MCDNGGMENIKMVDWAQGYAERMFDERLLTSAQQYQVRLAALDGIRDAHREIAHGPDWIEDAKALIKERMVAALPANSPAKPPAVPSATDAARRKTPPAAPQR